MTTDILMAEIRQLRKALWAVRGPFRDYVHAAGDMDERDAAIMALVDSALESAGQSAPGAAGPLLHTYRPDPDYPWFCDACGYPEHERIQHPPRDSGSDPEGGDALAAPGEASQSGGEAASPETGIPTSERSQAVSNSRHPLSGQK